MDLEELVVGVKKVDLNELKELKVKLPVRLLVNLHYVKLTESRGISDVVNEALTNYFAERGGPRDAPDEPSPPDVLREAIRAEVKIGLPPVR